MEKVQIVGTTGNLYEVVIGLVPRCTCPDSQKGNQCKHIIYVSSKFKAFRNRENGEKFLI